MREYDDWEVEIHKAAMTYRAASVQDAPEAFEALLRAARQPAAPSVEQDERGAFERYYFGRSYAGTWNAVRDGEYIVERVSDAWKAWQARAVSPSANVAQGAEAQSGEPSTDELKRMAYLLKLVPEGEAVIVDWLNILRNQFNAAMKVRFGDHP